MTRWIDEEDLYGVEGLPEEREEEHHGKDLHAPCKSIEQSVVALPVGTCEIILEEIDEQVGSDICRRIEKYDGDDHRHGLIIAKERLEHLSHRRRLHIDRGLLLDADTGDADEDDEQYPDHDGEGAEAQTLDLER